MPLSRAAADAVDSAALNSPDSSPGLLAGAAGWRLCAARARVQAGAKVVYAVEASGMAHYARQLAAANPGAGDRIRVLHGKVEEVEVPEKVCGAQAAGLLGGGGGVGLVFGGQEGELVCGRTGECGRWSTRPCPPPQPHLHPRPPTPAPPHPCHPTPPHTPSKQVDVLVSEPMGTLLVNERMIESYVYARDKFLKPGGAYCWM